jgi:hypothetical protein
VTDYDDDIQYDDSPCPECGEYEVRSRDCYEITCDDGWCDEYEDDPINFAPGEEYTMCHECLGTGVLRWCAKCGCDITRREYFERNKKAKTDD